MVTDVNADVVVDAMTMSNPLQGDMVVRTFTQLLAAQDKPRPPSDKPRPQSDKPRPSPADKPGVCAPQEKQKLLSFYFTAKSYKLLLYIIQLEVCMFFFVFYI